MPDQELLTIWGKVVFVRLALLCIKAQSAELIKTDKLIDYFSSAKARKKIFF